MYAYAELRTAGGFHGFIFMHNAHNLSAIVLATISLYFNDDDIFNERVGILFSLSYFLIDFVDCLKRMDIAYTIHAFFCLSLGCGNYMTPVCRALRTNSKACFFELSSPFMNLAQTTRDPLHFAVFFLVFTSCRIIWLPIMMKQLHDEGLLFMKDIRQILMLGFYGLNLFWYSKMVKIVLKNVSGGKGEKDDTAGKDDKKEKWS